MNHTKSIRGFSGSKILLLKQASLLFAAWVLIGVLLTFARITHPAFGVQGDLPLHYYITRSYERSFSEGEVLPRWAGLLDGGRGDALFTFYPPLSYLLSAVLMKLFGIGALTSLKAVSLLTLIVAQASSYVFARQFFNRRQSLACSVIYVLLPAYPLIALHRAFVANAVALSLLPFSLLGAHLLLSGERRARGLAIFAVSFSALILTHAITTYLCALAISLMALIYLPNFGWRGLARLAGAGIVTLTLTMFFLWPQWVESGWTQIGLQTVQQDYRNYFLFAKSSDGSAYRQSWANVNQTASLITLAQTTMALLLGLMLRKILSPRKTPGRLIAAAWFGLALAAFGLIISLPISGSLWRYLPGLKFVQFPWRFQPLVALGCGLLAAAAIEMWPTLNPKSRMRVLAFLTWAVIFNAAFTVMLARLDEPDIAREQVANLLIAPNAKPVTLEEARRLQNEDDLKYIPYAANQIYFRPPGSDFNLYPPALEPGGISIISGRGRVVSQKLHIAHREFLIESEDLVRARIETYHYPHWVARLDGREIRINAEQDSGLMLVDLPSGVHNLKLDYEVRETSERIARVVSLAAWLLFGGWGIFKLLSRIRRKPDFRE
ncbi:MAG: 6-pyruvoyl-tetrahydropterin synthase-related protein [Blastocatellales bacterium]